MKKMLSICLGLLFSFIGFAADKRFDNLVVFGDSLSDNGNLYKYLFHRFPVSPPYYKGQFSNGPVWIEQLRDSYQLNANLKKYSNYAVGGAGAVVFSKQPFPFSLAMELNQYFLGTLNKKKNSTLFVIWMGGNNYLFGKTKTEPTTDKVINAITKGVERLIKKGGNKFLLINLPDLSKTPYAINHLNKKRLLELVQVHNRKLANKIAQLKRTYPDITFVSFDIYSFFNERLEHAKDYGFNNVDEACYELGYPRLNSSLTSKEQMHQWFLKQGGPELNESHWEMINNNPDLMEAALVGFDYQSRTNKLLQDQRDCDTYVFWDSIHPSTRTHSFVAQKARELLDEAGLKLINSYETAEMNQ